MLYYNVFIKLSGVSFIQRRTNVDNVIECSQKEHNYSSMETSEEKTCALRAWCGILIFMVRQNNSVLYSF